MEHSEQPAIEQSSMNGSKWYGYKLVGDDLDRNIKPRYMRMTNQTKSKHYFNSYAVKDRVNLCNFSSFWNGPDSACKINAADILPSVDDEALLKRNLSILVSRILVDNVPSFRIFEDVIDRHIQHEFSSAMSTKSEVVSILYRYHKNL